MEGHINTYGGLDKDTAYDTIKQNKYIDALDIRITTTTGESQGAFTNIKGNKYSFTIPTSGTFNEIPWNIPASGGTPEVIGYTTIRNVIILFVADDLGKNGWIYKIEYDPASRELTVPPVLIYYSDALNFKKEWPIEALGRFENQDIQRVYWTDYNNYFRSLNIQDNNLVTTLPGQIDVFPNVNFNMPLLESVSGGGSLDSGSYQIAYRLITFDGKETLISPPSMMIPVYSSGITDTYPSIYGNVEKTNTGKTLTFTVDTSDYSNYEKIEFFSLYYENSTATPVATSVEIITLTGANTTTFIYTGAEGTIFDIELFSFTTKNFAFKTFKSITQKDNYLVGANIKASTIDVQQLLEGGSFDAKTRRYNGDSTPEPPFPIGGTNPGGNGLTGNNDLDNAFNLEFNKDSHWNVDWQSNAKQYKYKSDGVTLGGDGPNISYTFHTEAMSIDGDSQPNYQNQGGPFYQSFDNHNLDDGYGQRNNSGYPDNTSPFISGLLRGYKRGETYRFGIVFYTLKGEATYIEYIGDIKFPDISEKDSSNNKSKSPYFPISITGKEYDAALPDTLTVGINLGIKFSIDFSTCADLLKNITGFQIVRCPRTNVDKRRLSSGILQSYWWNRIVSSSSPSNKYEFRVNNSENVVHLSPYFQDATNRLDHRTLRYFMDEQDPNTLGSIYLHNTTTDHAIRSQHLAFYSPELTYDYTGIKDIGGELSNNPCLLFTGVYNTTINTAANTKYINHATNALSNNMEIDEYFIKLRSVEPVTFNSIENIKKAKGISYFNMKDSRGITAENTSTFLGLAKNTPSTGTKMNGPSYARSFYMFSPYGLSNRSLNDPGDEAVGTGTIPSIISRGGTNITALVDLFNTDPLTGNPVSYSSPTDYFILNGQTIYPASTDPEKQQIQPFLKTGTSSANPLSMIKSIPIADLTIPRVEVYGGTSESALTNNTFIMASANIQTTFGNNTYSPEVFGGDIFINMMQLQERQVELNASYYEGGSTIYERSDSTNILFAVESVINLNLDHGSTISRGVTKDVLGEDAAKYRQEDSNSTSTYGVPLVGQTAFTMFAYNEVYSRINKEVLFFIKPENLNTLSLVNDVRSYLSAIKVNNETIDSWTKFGINDYYDVDDHGPINKIINYKDNVYFMQDQGTGVYAINREAVTTTDDGVPTELGTAKGWGKHQYYSKEVGCIHQWAVVATNSAIYFFDAIHRKIYKIGAGKSAAAGLQTTPLSELKGMHSYLQFLGKDVFLRKENGGDNPILLKGTHIGVDEINDEIIFTFLSTTDLEKEDVSTIVFDELANEFSTRLSVNPKIWINNGDTLISSNPSNNEENNFYIHNIGNWGEFYDNKVECNLTLVINPKADINKVLRYLEFNSIVRNNNKIIDRTKTITAFKIKTETQDSGKIFYSADRIKRRFDKWRIKLPRDINSTNQKGRFRSTHFLLTLYFDNDDNKELIMNRLISYYDSQMF